MLCTFATVPLALPIAEAHAIPCLLVPLQIAEPTREFGSPFLGGRNLGPWLNKAVPELAGRLGMRAFAGLIREVRTDLGLPKTVAPGYRPDAVPVLHGVSPTVISYLSAMRAARTRALQGARFSSSPGSVWACWAAWVLRSPSSRKRDEGYRC